MVTHLLSTMSIHPGKLDCTCIADAVTCFRQHMVMNTTCKLDYTDLWYCR